MWAVPGHAPRVRPYKAPVACTALEAHGRTCRTPSCLLCPQFPVKDCDAQLSLFWVVWAVQCAFLVVTGLAYARKQIHTYKVSRALPTLAWLPHCTGGPRTRCNPSPEQASLWSTAAVAAACASQACYYANDYQGANTVGQQEMLHSVFGGHARTRHWPRLSKSLPVAANVKLCKTGHPARTLHGDPHRLRPLLRRRPTADSGRRCNVSTGCGAAMRHGSAGAGAVHALTRPDRLAINGMNLHALLLAVAGTA